jgi:hypothetical protein
VVGSVGGGNTAMDAIDSSARVANGELKRRRKQGNPS